jgi:hypothetical protein
MTLDASGNLGIGSTNPGAILDIRKAASGTVGPTLSLINSASTAAGNAVDINMAGNPGGGALNPTGRIRLTETASALSTMSFWTYDGTFASRMVIDPSGNLGLGTTAPATLFHMLKNGVGGSAPNQPELRIQHNDINAIGTTGSNGGILGFVNLQRDNTGWVADTIWGRINFSCSQPTSGAAQLGASILAAADGAIGGQQSASYLAFYTSDGTNGGNNIEKARITNAGQLLVNTTSPYNSAKFSVLGDSEQRGNIRSYLASRGGLASGGTVTLWSVGNGSFGTEVSMTLYIAQRDDSGGSLSSTTYNITAFAGGQVIITAISVATYGASKPFSVTGTSTSGGIVVTMTNLSGSASTSINMSANVLYGYGALTWGF